MEGEPKLSVATINHRAYGGRKAVDEYVRFSTLFLAERVILDKLRPEIKGKRLLDIGVGAGRTTAALLDISRHYTAIDYSAEMVHATRKRFSLQSIWCCDARDMNRFPDSSFDFAMFAFNGIDSLPYSERSRAIAEVMRVLASGGIFVFSSHNRDLRDIGKLPWQCSSAKLTPSLIKQSLIAVLRLPRRMRLKPHEVYAGDYAIVNDSGVSYSLLTCYVTISAQTRELLRSGFREVSAYDLQGRVIVADDSSPWIYYVARK
jgi:ubiquinone/menaquinone biosynthesis C-methylase UbiE